MLVETGSSPAVALRAAKPKKKRKKDLRPSAARRGYGRKWWAARLEFLKVHSTCAYCRVLLGRTVTADQIDHNPPHKGDAASFWDRATWVPSCKWHNQHFAAKFDGALGHPIKPRPVIAGIHPEGVV